MNQTNSVALMVDYIVKYQNSFVYSHLFKFNLVDLILRGVPCTSLFQSNIFDMNVSYVEWPMQS